LLTPGKDHRERCTGEQEAAYSGVGVFFGSGKISGGETGTTFGTATAITSAKLNVPPGRFVAINSHAFFDERGVAIFPLRGNLKLPDPSAYKFYSPPCGKTYQVRRVVFGTTDPEKEEHKDFAFAEVADKDGKPLCAAARSMEIRVMPKGELDSMEDQNVLSTVGMYYPIDQGRPRTFRQEDMRCYYSHGTYGTRMDPPRDALIVYHGTLDTEKSGSGGPLVFKGDTGLPEWSGVHAKGKRKVNVGVIPDEYMLKVLSDFVKRR